VFSVRRINPSDWRTNVSCGATAEAFSAGAELVAMAHRAAEAIGATVAGVDILLARDGQPYVLEVNAVPGWQATARALGVDVAAAVLEYLESIAGSRNEQPAGYHRQGKDAKINW
jgi:ribosomal protein S6--L-glutamate ligase/tetrahydromethanopterin:alpha-L-glutamate ligase